MPVFLKEVKMIQLSNYLLNMDFNELLRVLEADDDIENVIIILQMMEINTFVEIEDLKQKLKELKESEDEDELLSDTNGSENQKNINKQLDDLNHKKDKIHSIIKSILEYPAEFWTTTKPNNFVNSLFGTIMISDNKSQRSNDAFKIICGLITAKNKNITKEEAVSRESLIVFLKKKQLGKELLQ